MSGPRALLFATFFALGVGLRTPTSPLQPRSKTAQPPVAFGYSSALTARGERDWLDQRYEASSSGSTKLPSALSDRDDDALLRNAVIAATAAQERRASPLEASDPERQPTAPPRAVQPMRARLDDAQARLLRAHMLLVFKIARRYAGRGVSEADLTQEGALGLLHAMRKFDPTRGVKFVTYAYYWVHTFVARAVDRESSLIRVPHHAAHRRRLIARLCAEIVAERGAEPTDAELAKAAGCTLNAVRLARNMPQVTSLDAALYPTDASYARDVSSDASRARSLGSNARTLSAVHDEDDAFTCVVDDEFGKCGSDERAARIDALLEHALQPHEQQIVRMHYGLGNALPMRQNAICRELNMSSFVQRRAQERALAALRKSCTDTCPWQDGAPLRSRVRYALATGARREPTAAHLRRGDAEAAKLGLRPRYDVSRGLTTSMSILGRD